MRTLWIGPGLKLASLVLLAFSLVATGVVVVAQGKDRGDAPPTGQPAANQPRAAPQPHPDVPQDPRTKAILDALERPLAMPFMRPTPIEDILKYIKKATERPELPSGIPILVDPQALTRADRTMTSPVSFDMNGALLGVSLRLILDQLGLGYRVKDGMVLITVAPTELPVGFSFDDATERMTTLIRETLGKPLDMPFRSDTPLEDILKYLKTASEVADFPDGLPVYVDPVGLDAAETSIHAPVRIDTKGRPLSESLAAVLGQLDLRYEVRDGLVLITAQPEVGGLDRAEAFRQEKSQATLDELKQTLSMPFGHPTPLKSLLHYVRLATRGPTYPEGVPIQISSTGLGKAGVTLASPVSIDLQGVPLGVSLRLVLGSLGLGYSVQDGLLTIAQGPTELPEGFTFGQAVEQRRRLILNTMRSDPGPPAPRLPVQRGVARGTRAPGNRAGVPQDGHRERRLA